jgi:hypothetical protein
LDELQAKVALPCSSLFARGVTLLTVGSIQRLGGSAPYPYGGPTHQLAALLNTNGELNHRLP